MCAGFGETSFFWASGSFHRDKTVSREECRTSWGLDHCSTDVVDPFRHVFLSFSKHGAVNMCFPEEGCELWWVLNVDGVPNRRM